MAEYYGKLQDNIDNSKSRKFKKILVAVLVLIIVTLIIIAFAGIFGDTERRDSTRAIIRENTELKQQIASLEQQIAELENENSRISKAVEKYEIEAGKTIEKPEGDMSETAEESEQTEE